MDDYSAGGGLAERIEFSAWRLGAGPVLSSAIPLGWPSEPYNASRGGR